MKSGIVGRIQVGVLLMKNGWRGGEEGKGKREGGLRGRYR